MSDCPYFDTSHSMADLYYVCKAGTHKRKISPGDVNNYPCLTGEYTHCLHYPGEEKTEDIEE